MARTILHPAAWIALVLAVPLVPACSGGGDGGSESGMQPQSKAGMEFNRRLRLGTEQLRRNLPESARAEFEACARLRPDDPELLFQRARLAPGDVGESGRHGGGDRASAEVCSLFGRTA